MSGHSKWSNIKNRKGAQDKKRSEVFTKMSKNIMTAVRTGGGNTNPEANIHLKTAIDKAKEVNMPKENIERLLKRFEERKANLSICQLEGFGPMAVPIMVEAETDNRNRTISEIKNIFKNFNGNMGSEGSVGFLFGRVGEIETEGISEEQELQLIDAGAKDFADKTIITEVNDLNQILAKTIELGIKVNESGVVMRSKQPVILPDENKVAAVMDLVEALEENEDVISVFAGFDYHG